MLIFFPYLSCSHGLTFNQHPRAFNDGWHVVLNEHQTEIGNRSDLGCAVAGHCGDARGAERLQRYVPVGQMLNTL